MARRRVIVPLAAAVVLMNPVAAMGAPSNGPGPLVPDPLISFPAGYSYTSLITGCLTPATSTESGVTLPYPEDPDANVLFQAPGNEYWLLSNAELTQPRSGDFQGDAGKCHVDEQTPGDDYSDGWGSVQRIVLAKDGTTVKRVEVIETGLHNLCAAAKTPWNTYLTNEEFPFIADPQQLSGWVWEVDPATGDRTRLTGMGRFSHEQETYASDGSWYLTDDRGDARFIYKFDPSSNRDLTTGDLYGLAFDRATGTGTWIGPLNPFDPDSDMRARGFQPATWGFTKAEGMVATGSSETRGGNAVYFSESGAGADPGRVWRLDHLGNDGTVRGHVVVEGDFARLGRPDNLRFNDAGDLFIMEDHSASDFTRGNTGGVNQMWVLPRHEEGAANLVLLAETPDEPTGAWFSFDGKLLYLSVQAEAPRVSHIIAVRAPSTWNRPID
jgi:secreted PhoX family phosphatase